MKIRIALIDDHPIFLAGLKRLIESTNSYEVSSIANSYKEALEKIDFDNVDIALVDVNMPGANGIELLKAIKQRSSACKVVMLTIEEDEETIYRAMKEGARGYILKQDSPERLLKSIQACVEGEILLSNQIYSKVVDRIKKVSPPESAQSIIFSTLTDREIEITRLIVQGKSNPEIAKTLYISESTVKNHISNILHKLEMKDRVELAILAVREGIG
ncbi:response regulator [Atribacter laminatus]|jgi:DNA-binding NarL/FixJ family response regulator|uniref:Transcriptional regulatory protein DegU n=1 Tax=Atribacter laminatus TaxID=2847778 RepID=A0A7T1ALR3_ATRLM|nr:response regulator transcription factor [Atribacter laminatus]QPM68248.1 Transcriptional regulatory protein DegU [Atribacter laminatus]